MSSEFRKEFCENWRNVPFESSVLKTSATSCDKNLLNSGYLLKIEL